MLRQPFNDEWTFGPQSTIFERLSPDPSRVSLVTLPHDAMLSGGRSPDSPNGANTAYFRPGAWQYEKAFVAPHDWATKRVSLEFEGVYRDAVVFVNDHFAGQWADGYSPFAIALDPFLNYGEANTVRVEARAYKDSRWYSGGGIHRPVHLFVGELVHFDRRGPRVITSDVERDLAVATILTDVVNESASTQTLTVVAEIRNEDGDPMVIDSIPLTVLAGETATARQRLYIESPSLWDLDDPTLCSVHVGLRLGDGQIDTAVSHFGIRSIALDPWNGLRLNGRSVKLRGACVHHDNGVIGSVAIASAEERRVRLLKKAGFNALRAAHSPLSVAMLDACDKFGMLVMDEVFDVWSAAKSEDDYSRRFATWWERDIEAMVTKNFNHPSVIFYSIGNEILEAGTGHGARRGRQIAERIRALDPSRLITNALNAVVAAVDLVPEIMANADLTVGEDDVSLNTVLGQMGPMMEAVKASSLAGKRLFEASSYLDVVGLNYAETRYAIDHAAYPRRVMVGTETFPSRIDKNWVLVKENDFLIGDFTWTGWDYLGEAGIGRPLYPGEEGGLNAAYPWLTSGAGDIDILGHRRPISFYREIVFGVARGPYVSVQLPQRHSTPFAPGAWSWSDSRSSWTWEMKECAPVVVETYADAEEVELHLNGVMVARVEIGVLRPYFGSAELAYKRGSLEAVAFRGGVEVGRCRLQSASDVASIRLSVEGTELRSGAADLAFVDIELVDASETLNPIDDRTVDVTVSGAGTLQGLGSANPAGPGSFIGSKCLTHEGRALAVIRPTGVGTVDILVTSQGLAAASLTLEVLPAPAKA